MKADLAECLVHVRVVGEFLDYFEDVVRFVGWGEGGLELLDLGFVQAHGRI